MVKTMQKNIRIEEESVRKLEKIAKHDDRSVSYEIRRAINNLIDSCEENLEGE